LKAAILAKHIAQLTLSKKASEVLIMNVRGLSSVTDFFVVCSADSDVQVRAIADAVEEGLEGKGITPYQAERGSPNWIVLDYVDVVLHIFHKTTRAFYNLEKLWGDAAVSEVDETLRAVGARTRKPTRKTQKRTRKPARPRKRAAS
jgi:ribosome-associated protein